VQVRDGRRIFSASDLVGYAACEHLTQLELAALRSEVERPNRVDPFLDILKRKGIEHEDALLAAYPAVVDARRIEGGDETGDPAKAAARTIDHMRAGEPVIYQAVFLHDSWLGYADFLERVDTPSELGRWSYEVVDAKLARAVRASAVVQLCEYSEHVTRIQSTAPRHLHVVTGDAERHTFRLADFAAYHRMLKQRFLATVAGDTAETYPEPVDHCGVCRWWAQCRDRRRADDHLSLVAFLGRDQTRKLVDAGIPTRAALAAATAGQRPATLNPATYERLRLQAALQVRGEGCTPPLWELVEPDPTDDTPRGFATLPPPSPGDVFLDLEGDPYAADGGLFYLFGVVTVVDGAPRYDTYWAHTKAEERAAFRAVVDLIMQRHRDHPDMHVYHYAPAEPSAFKRLMGEHGTCEDDVDTMLRAQLFVDLYRVTRQAVRCSTESYSLKEMERCYFERPGEALLDAGAIIAYEHYLLDSDPARLDQIAEYNRADCESLVGLCAWLEERRLEAEARFGSIPRPGPPDPAELEIPPDDNAQLAAALLAALPDDFVFSRAVSDGVEVRIVDPRGDTATVVASPNDEARYVLAHLLEWHRREGKPAWWWFYERRDKYEPDQFVDDKDCIGGLELVEELGRDKQSLRYRLRFPVQEHKFSAGASPHIPGTGGSAGTIEAIDDTTLILRRAVGRRDEPLPHSLMPGGALQTNAQRAALADVANWVLDHEIDADGPYRAVRDLLLRRAPRLAGASDTEPLRHDGEPSLDAACRIVGALERGYLAVQGPPGTGKTHTGAHMIVALLDAGKRVGITATTHNAITGLLAKVVEVAGKAGVAVDAIQKPDDGGGLVHDDVRIEKVAGVVEAAIVGGDVNLAAGTAWLWARPGLRESVDVLFVDEAGQMSLADTVAVGTAARNLVLLGDPQQLAQVSQGAHPVGAGASALEHVLGDHDTIPDDLGLFIDQTWRMHPSVCRFVSEIAYDDRLTSVSGAAGQSVDDASGLWLVEVAHSGDATGSPDEAAAVAALFSRLLGRTWINEEGQECTVSLRDLLVVAPYNAHVAELRAALPDGARVGTVDKFQGQEGAVAIYSTASSSVDDAPRGLSFLYDLHRLNVAVSRARARAYIVASPELLRANCRSPRELQLANALCRYAELATAADG
jgi:uncharacterized protein